MRDIRESPYAEFLENLCHQMMELQPVRIGLCAITEDGTTMTGYFGEICPEDKAVMAYHLQSDAIMDTVMANAKMIVEAAEETEEEDQE